jgi:hypothetical protein
VSNTVDTILIVTCIVAALLLGAVFGLVAGRVGRASCPHCGRRLTCAFHETVAREVQRTGYPVQPQGSAIHNLDGYGLSGAGQAPQ